MDNWLCAKY